MKGAINWFLLMILLVICMFIAVLFVIKFSKISVWLAEYGLFARMECPAMNEEFYTLEECEAECSKCKETHCERIDTIWICKKD